MRPRCRAFLLIWGVMFATLIVPPLTLETLPLAVLCSGAGAALFVWLLRDAEREEVEEE